MGTIRYGARSEERLRNREVEATSVDVWATTLVATYLTDPEIIAAVLPPPIGPGAEPLVKVTVATVDIAGYPTFGAGSSWLVDLTAEAFAKSPELEEFSGSVSDSGEGRWTSIATVTG